jgi:hypothetical protein
MKRLSIEVDGTDAPGIAQEMIGFFTAQSAML